MAAAAASVTPASLSSSFSSLSIRTPPRFFSHRPHKALSPIPSSYPPPPPSLLSLSSSRLATFPSLGAKTNDGDTGNDIDTSFFDNLNPGEDVAFEQPPPPEGFVPPPYFDEGPFPTEDEIAAAYEKLYGPVYSGVSVLGNDVYVMDSKKKMDTGWGSSTRTEKIKDGFDERVVEVRRVTKVVKGGKRMNFRATVVVGDKKGRVGVGVGKAKEVIDAVQKSAVDARRNIITVPMTKYSTFPHRSDGDFGAAKVMLRPASPGTGVIAGGAVRIVLEMAGVENALGKQLRSSNALNNARATVVAIQKMRHLRDVALERGIPMEELWK